MRRGHPRPRVPAAECEHHGCASGPETVQIAEYLQLSALRYQRRGLAWVSVRASFFARNTLDAWGAQIRAGDIVRGPYPSFAESPIHERDLAEVAARALLTDAPVARRGRRLELTGPQSLTHQQMVVIIGEVLGRPLRYQEVPPEAPGKGMTASGLPEPFVQVLMARYAREASEPAPLTGEVQRILGRPARAYAEWVADHAAAFQG
jgi:uncharacterized protein YbjT (DUF2867 family)